MLVLLPTGEQIMFQYGFLIFHLIGRRLKIQKQTLLKYIIIYSKLLKLKDNMNTETAKKTARKRHKYLEAFLDEFFKEWQGEL